MQFRCIFPIFLKTCCTDRKKNLEGEAKCLKEVSFFRLLAVFSYNTSEARIDFDRFFGGTKNHKLEN